MSLLIFWLFVFVISLALLVKASDWFIDAAEKISLAFKISPFIIGISIVALGTSLPELVSSIVAVLNDSSEIVISNVTGSNIANVLFVLGAVAVVGKKLDLDIQLQPFDLVAFFASAIYLAATVWVKGYFGYIDAVICLVGLVTYMWYTFYQGNKISKKAEAEAKAARVAEAEALVEAKEREQVVFQPKNLNKRKAWRKRNEVRRQMDIQRAIETLTEEQDGKLEWYVVPMLLLSSVAIYFSANYNIQSIIRLSEILNIGTEIISLTAVSLGTSLPELFVSVSAVLKKTGEMAVGNILGSNIFNILCVMGITRFIGDLAIPSAVSTLSLPVMLLATVLYFLFLRDKKLHWWEGVVLLLFYALFTIKLVVGM